MLVWVFFKVGSDDLLRSLSAGVDCSMFFHKVVQKKTKLVHRHNSDTIHHKTKIIIFAGREETVFGEHLNEACELSESLRVMEKMHSTEKVTESAILDKSLSSLEEEKTSVAEAAVCLPPQVEKSLAIKCSDKILVCLLEAQE